MSSNKRPAGNFTADLLKKKAKTDTQTAANADSAAGNNPGNKNRYLSTPVQPERALAIFLTETRNAARRFLPKETTQYPIQKPFCEVEARFGILKLPFGNRDRRVTSSGPKQHSGQVVKAFHCHQEPHCAMESGVSRTHFSRWTQGGLVRYNIGLFILYYSLVCLFKFNSASRSHLLIHSTASHCAFSATKPFTLTSSRRAKWDPFVRP